MSTRDALEEAEETLLRARRGDDVSRELLAHLRALDERVPLFVKAADPDDP